MYLIVSNIYIRAVTIIRTEGDMCLVRFTDGEGGIRVHRSRVYETKEKAEAMLPRKKTTKISNPLGPYAYWH